MAVLRLATIACAAQSAAALNPLVALESQLVKSTEAPSRVEISRSFLESHAANVATFLQARENYVVSNSVSTCDAQEGFEAPAMADAAAAGATVSYDAGVANTGSVLTQAAMDTIRSVAGADSAHAAQASLVAAAAAANGAAQIASAGAQSAAGLPNVMASNGFCTPSYPVSAASAATASVSGEMAGAFAQSLPGLIAVRAGKMSDSAYATCFDSMMSLGCAALMPRAAGNGDSLAPCASQVLTTLVACPGMTVSDLPAAGHASVEPVCTAHSQSFSSVRGAQAGSFDDVHAFGACPTPLTASASGAAGAGAVAYP